MQTKFSFMKTNLLKTTSTLLAFLIPICSAFIFDKTEKQNMNIVPGYIQFPDLSTPCQYSMDCCIIDDNPICTVLNNGKPFQAYGKVISGNMNCPMVITEVM